MSIIKCLYHYTCVATHIVKSRLALQTDLACYDIHFEMVPLPSGAILNVYINATVVV